MFYSVPSQDYFQITRTQNTYLINKSKQSIIAHHTIDFLRHFGRLQFFSFTNCVCSNYKLKMNRMDMNIDFSKSDKSIFSIKLEG